MEYLGITLKKEFAGFGVFTGTVKSFNGLSGLFKIVYEDGDSEELELAELVTLLGDSSNLVRHLELNEQKRRPGRKPKRRRRVEQRKGQVSEFGNGEISGNVNLTDEVGELVEVGIGSGRDLNASNSQCFADTKLDSNVDSNGGFRTSQLGFDLNAAGFDLNLNEKDSSGEGANLSLEFRQNLMKTKCIDLNLDAIHDTKEVDLVGNLRKRRCDFDLNLGAAEEVRDETVEDCRMHVKENPQIEVPRRTEVGSERDTSTGVHISEGSYYRFVDGHQVEDAVTNCDNQNDGNQYGFRGDYEQVSSQRKRRKILDHPNTATERVLRRSARKGSCRYNAPESTESRIVNVLSIASVASVASVTSVVEEKPLTSDSIDPDEPTVLPPKLELPPSSEHFDLGGKHTLDIFSIYSCLRSFSTLLFLSPFELEDFVASLKCKFPTTLFDCIHLSILQMLRKHLECLSNEGCQTASNCLRNLNWDFLDVITWPIFMVEYLVTHGSGLKPEFNLNLLKLFENDYYKQSLSVKIEILRCLCDDMIEAEPIRSELNKRLSAAESVSDFDRNGKIDVHKKRRSMAEVSGSSTFCEEVVNETNDWNNDECCLCKMDGSLICCDGCPAAYHSKCVGVVSDSLPEGEWYCPECAIDRNKHWMKPRKSLRGAELLGVDRHGRLYFSSCGYLLVSDLPEAQVFFNYYHRDDMSAIIDVLKSSDGLYIGILNAIHKLWDIPNYSAGASSNVDFGNRTVYLDTCKPETISCKSDIPNVRETEKRFVRSRSVHLDTEGSKSLRFDLEEAVEIPYMSSEGSSITAHISSDIPTISKEKSCVSMISAEISNLTYPSEKSPTIGLEEKSLLCTSFSIKQDTNIKYLPPEPSPSEMEKAGDALQLQEDGSCYVNCFNFAYAASSVAEKLSRKPSDKITADFVKSEEEIISLQMKAIWKKSMNFCWSSAHNASVNVQKEKCGWCICCKAPTDGSDCLFNIIKGTREVSQEESRSESENLQSQNKRKCHFIDVINHVLSIEERLRGLLLGPWLNPHYSKVWRKNALKTSDIVSAKHLLLTLESNLRRIVLSPEWYKHVDSMATMGSASHDVTASFRSSSKQPARKKGRCSEFENNPSSHSVGGPLMLWWRGGRYSRKLFSWKVLPRALVSKAARQAGCMKIPGIHYLENTDYARRIKYMVWRASVESTTSIDQLALRVRELDSIIKWDEIENPHLLSKLDKDFGKAVKLFRKVIIRKKCAEGEGLKYLLDFGKRRRTIPDVVVKNGSKVEDSSSEKKKYWLNESFVPLYLLKSFEEKNIARMSSKMSSKRFYEAVKAVKKPSRGHGFQYLFSKAERSEYYQCGHCNKDVLTREAVCCEHCKGYFHKRHVRTCAAIATAECTYTCHQCHEINNSTTDTKKGKKRGRKSGRKTGSDMKPELQNDKDPTKSCRLLKLKAGRKSKNDMTPELQNDKNLAKRRRLLKLKGSKKISINALGSKAGRKTAAGITLRRSARKASKHVPLQKKKIGEPKKRKHVKSRKRNFLEQKEDVPWRKRRTQTYSSYWINGLQMSRKPDDERVIIFKSKTLLAAFDHMTVNRDRQRCQLCGEAGDSSHTNYIACELCGDWFHGEAFGLDMKKVSLLIGFKCYMCRKRKTPFCPRMQKTGIQVSQIAIRHSNDDKRSVAEQNLEAQNGHEHAPMQPEREDTAEILNNDLLIETRFANDI